MSMSMSMSLVHDLEYDLMKFCLKHRGKWWATHFFYNDAVADLYMKLRSLDVGTVMVIVEDGSPAYHKHIDLKTLIDKKLIK